MTNLVDDLVRGSYGAAEDEPKHRLSRIDYADMTAVEVVAFVTLLRPMFDRVWAETTPEVPVLRLAFGGSE